MRGTASIGNTGMGKVEPMRGITIIGNIGMGKVEPMRGHVLETQGWVR